MPIVQPESPPKRMTRARARAAEEKQQTQIITTAGAKAASKPKAAGRSQTTKKEQVKIAATKASAAQATKAKSKATEQKIAQTVDETEPEQFEDEIVEEIQPKTRKRTVTQEKSESKEAGSNTQARAANRSARVVKPAAKQQPHARNGPATRKKVTLQHTDTAEKENKTEARGTGKAKATEGGTNTMSKAPKRGRKAPVASKGANIGATETSVAGQPRGEPLSPKKVCQVAKGEVDKGDDVVVAPTQAAVPSPQRHALANPGNANMVDAQAFAKEGDLGDSVDELQLPQKQSPVKDDRRQVTMSPPKRLPQSPYKNAMKESPRKLNIGTPRSNSPVKQAVEVQAFTLQTPAKKPPSPIKLTQDDPFTFRMQTPATIAKTSLLQTSARRPPSGMKPILFPSHPAIGSMSVDRCSNKPSILRQSPQKFKLPALPTSPSKQRTFEVYSPAEKRTTPEKSLSEPTKEVFPPTEDTLPFEVEVPVLENQVTSTDNTIMENAQEQVLDCIASGDDMHNAPDILHLDDTEESNNPSQILEFSIQQLQEDTMPRQTPLCDDSEDELMSNDPKYDASPKRHSSLKQHATPSQSSASHKDVVSMTGLAKRFDAWQGATPDARVLAHREASGFLFSPLKQPQPLMDEKFAETVSSPDCPEEHRDAFAEAMDIHEDNEDDAMVDETSFSESIFQKSIDSECSQAYADENALPVDPALLPAEPSQLQTCTPQRLERIKPQVVHTVSKVPLKPAADAPLSPSTKIEVKKRRSLANALTPRTDLELQALRQIYPLSTSAGVEQASQPANESQPLTDVDTENSATPRRVSSLPQFESATPGLTPRADINKKLLEGVIVFVDVHTSEGADASGIFVELLQQMGATVRSSWNWSPERDETDDAASNELKPGITHVVFKDGGKRTMEKVRDAKGAVACVGVSWVLDCEKENRRVAESKHAIDTAFIPRGGHRRRKSMEPRRLSHFQGTLSTIDSPTKLDSSDFASTALDTSQDFNFLSSPVKTPASSAGFQNMDLEDELTNSPATGQVDASHIPLPMTPARPNMLTGGENSPTTPYFLHAEQLVQQTCPPKQTQQVLFPLSGRIRDQPNEHLRQRLAHARRKSLQFAPKVKSPLSKGFEDDRLL